MSHCHDVLGIGFGPANLALAIALREEDAGLDMRFLEASAPGTPWQGGMMLPGSDIQNHPVRDLVSLRNPRSRYSFINYLFEQGRLLDHLNLPVEFPLRKEYAQYIDWVAGHFARYVEHGTTVVGVEVAEHPEHGSVYRVTAADGRDWLARTLVVGTGRAPYVPAPFDALDDPRVCHLTRYLPTLRALRETAGGPPREIAVIGGSQSAVELTLDLSHRFPEARVTVWARSHSLREKDTSPFSEEGYFPGFTDYYYRASREGKRALDAYMRPTNYSSADGDVLRELYVRMYEQRLDGEERISVRGSRRITTAEAGPDGIRFDAVESVTGATEQARADLVVLATGFRDLGPGERQDRFPQVLAGVADRLAFDADGYLDVSADYETRPSVAGTPPLFLNGLCESSHGIGDAGSFSLLSIRAKTISDGLRKLSR
ncbi:SidA/IucD/PvdA family monooxygenase [Kitasatospora sp. NPDC056651]|uniref:SidA/IucD/PvdA family monooxygenase n=1 Tax=Kitasatospora sp. NPDC056651 TaxID=3345892 RepID=UPI0036CBD8A0